TTDVDALKRELLPPLILFVADGTRESRPADVHRDLRQALIGCRTVPVRHACRQERGLTGDELLHRLPLDLRAAPTFFEQKHLSPFVRMPIAARASRILKTNGANVRGIETLYRAREIRGHRRGRPLLLGCGLPNRCDPPDADKT